MMHSAFSKAKDEDGNDQEDDDDLGSDFDPLAEMEAEDAERALAFYQNVQMADTTEGEGSLEPEVLASLPAEDNREELHAPWLQPEAKPAGPYTRTNPPPTPPRQRNSSSLSTSPVLGFSAAKPALGATTEAGDVFADSESQPEPQQAHDTPAVETKNAGAEEEAEEEEEKNLPAASAAPKRSLRMVPFRKRVSNAVPNDEREVERSVPEVERPFQGVSPQPMDTGSRSASFSGGLRRPSYPSTYAVGSPSQLGKSLPLPRKLRRASELQEESPNGSRQNSTTTLLPTIASASNLLASVTRSEATSEAPLPAAAKADMPSGDLHVR
jgi:hypothetical protein